MKYKYPGSVIEKADLIPVYEAPHLIYHQLYGNEMVFDAEDELTRLWDRRRPQDEAEYLDFYYNNKIVPQELIQWHKKNNFRRISRAIYAGGIANYLECKTFAEYGCGIGSDAVALTLQGLDPEWLCDVNLQNLAITENMFRKFTEFEPKIFNVTEGWPDNMPKTDLLYSSDVFEHLIDLEGFLEPWIRGFYAVIVYAPFGSNEVQHQHTSYPADRFHSFMARMGYQKIVFNLAVPPFVYITRRAVPEFLRKVRKDGNIN